MSKKTNNSDGKFEQREVSDDGLSFDSHVEMSESLKRISRSKPKKYEEEDYAERDGDGTREFSMTRYYGYVKAKLRSPKSNRFVKGLITFAIIGTVLIALLLAVVWRYTEISVNGLPETRVQTLVRNTNADGWRQLLRKHLPEAYADYENSSELAYKVLSPALNVGKVTYLPVDAEEGAKAYALFSDGDHFADVVYSKTDGFAPLFGEWEQKSLTFDLSFIKSVEFPLTSIIIPSGATYSVNGKENPAPANTLEGTVYPGRSPAEENPLENCVTLEFNDIYFVPELSAKLGGVELILHSDDEKRSYWFEYPETAYHTLSVTVPAGADAFVGGRELDESWAERVSAEGELGELDDGGTGTLPALSVWTVKGLFDETSVSASINGNPLTLKSSENHSYVFNIPAECKYTVTVICPADCVLTVNGRIAGTDDKLPGGATSEELGNGKTVLGRYSVSELSAVEGAMPFFDKYVLTGYLAMPVISVKLNDTELKAAAYYRKGYDARWEFDLPVGGSEACSDAVLSGAIDFFDAYVKYLCDGGIYTKGAKGLVYNAENAELFDKNYNSILEMMVKGSSGYKSVMETYRDVSLMKHYGAFEISDLQVSDCIVYTDRCVSCVVSGKVLRGDAPVIPEAEDEEEAPVYNGPAVVGETDSIGVTLCILEVQSGGVWRTWGFICTTEPLAG